MTPSPKLLELQRIKRTDPRLLANMAVHYSQPHGFVGRNICYAIMVGGTYYGAIVGGSSTLHLAGRDEFFGILKTTKKATLLRIVNNIFYHIEKQNGRYPIRNMVPHVLAEFRKRITRDWFVKYGDEVIGFESLIELPRTGDAYKRDGWQEVGITKGQTCKRVAGKGTDNWTGKRVWDTKNLRPKRVFVRRVKCEPSGTITSCITKVANPIFEALLFNFGGTNLDSRYSLPVAMME